MCKKFSSAVFVLLLGALSVSAQFEGVIEMKTTVNSPEGAAHAAGGQKVFLSGAGTRMEMDMQMAQDRMRMVILSRTDTPNVMYKINDGDRTYMEIDLDKAQRMAAQFKGETQYTVEQLGEEVLQGYKTRHIRVTNLSRPEDKTEMWTTKELGDSGTVGKMLARQGGRASAGEGLHKALQEANADGMSLKTVICSENGTKVLMEVVKIDKKPLPASIFEIPEGYTKSEGGVMGAVGGMSGPKVDAAREQMQEAMKKMTPEQRAMMEKMMKQMKGGSQ